MRHKFVEHIPETLEQDVVYISVEFDTAVHACACGCGIEVVTPLSPAQWSLTYDGQSVSLSPSIGNWNFPCNSHYWIRKGRVEWSSQFSAKEVAAVQAKDKSDLARQHRRSRPQLEQRQNQAVASNQGTKANDKVGQRRGLLARLIDFFR